MKNNFTSFQKQICLLSFLVAFLTACGGGSDEKPTFTLPPQQNANGVWYGDYTSPDGENYPAQALMNDGNFVLTYTGDGTDISLGNYTTIINNITLSSSKYRMATPVLEGVGYLYGVVYTEGTMLLDSPEGDQYSLLYSPQQSETLISYEMILGSLTIPVGDGELIRFFIDDSGNIFNDDSFYCDFSGNIKIPNDQKNMLVIDMVISGGNCIHSGVYNGLGAFFVGYDGLLFVYFHNGTNGYIAVNNINQFLGR